MSATRSLYVPLAKTIRYHVDGADALTRQAIDRLVRDLTHDLKTDNRAFDRDRFMTACGLS